MDIVKEDTRYKEMQLALESIIFELSTMPPMFSNSSQPFGITCSLEIAKKALNNSK